MRPRSVRSDRWWRNGNPSYNQFSRPRLQFRELAELDDPRKLSDELKRLAGV